MVCQKIIDLLDNTRDQPTKFMTKICVETNDDSRGSITPIVNVHKFNLQTYIHTYIQITHILVKETITLVGQGADTAATEANRNNKQVIFKNSAPLTDCITDINNAQVDYAKDLHVVMPMYHLREYSYNYSGTFASL